MFSVKRKVSFSNAPCFTPHVLKNRAPHTGAIKMVGVTVLAEWMRRYLGKHGR